MERFVYSHFEFHAASCILRYNWIMLTGLKKYYNRSLPSGCSSSSKVAPPHPRDTMPIFTSAKCISTVVWSNLRDKKVLIDTLLLSGYWASFFTNGTMNRLPECLFLKSTKELTCICHWDCHIGIDCSHKVPQAPLRDRGSHLDKHSTPDRVTLYHNTLNTRALFTTVSLTITATIGSAP